MPASNVLVPHDDGQLRVAELLDQYRDRRDGSWRVVVRYTVEPGFAYIRAEPTDRRRAVDDPPAGWTDPREDASTPSSPRHAR